MNYSSEPSPDQEGTLASSEEGFSLVMSLWLMALMGIVGGLFAYESLQRTRMTDSIVRRENAYTMARARVDLWMGQLRADFKEEEGDSSAHDAQTENWGWGGELKSGVSMGDTLYLPSGSASYQEGDIGFVAIEEIQEETGKHNLNKPLGTSGDTATKIMKKLPVSSLENALSKPDTFWVSPGDVVYVSGIGSSGYEKSLNVVSPYRSGGKININTATPQAMEGIIIRNFGDTEAAGDGCYYNSCDYFFGDTSEDLITAIMEARSGGSSTEEEKESLIAGGGDAFETTGEVCSIIENEGGEGEQDFQCETFKKYVRVHSEGVFRVLVRGGSIDSNGEVLNQTTLEAYVDRAQDPMQLISLRSP